MNRRKGWRVRNSEANQGATELTRMPSAAHSHARLRVSWFIAAARGRGRRSLRQISMGRTSTETQLVGSRHSRHTHKWLCIRDSRWYVGKITARKLGAAPLVMAYTAPVLMAIGPPATEELNTTAPVPDAFKSG